MHSQIVEHLRSCADKGRFPHSLLFTEREGYGAIALVLEVLKYLFCREGGIGADGLEAEQTRKKIERLVHPDIRFGENLLRRIPTSQSRNFMRGLA